MTITPLNAALLAAGLTGGVIAIALNAPQFDQQADAVHQPANTTQSANDSFAQTAVTPQIAPIPALAAGAPPDFRAIVKRAGPAVVGVTVEGMRRAGHEEQDESESAAEPQSPFSPFFLGQRRQGRHHQA